jgi:Ca2+-binding RTX toxin-like protein
MRDRSGFDFDSNGEADRAPGQPTFSPGLSLVYTNEAHGYGNAGVNDPPAQSPLDSQPQPGVAAPNLDDAAWTDGAGDSHFTDAGEGHTDNYEDPANEEVDSRYPAVAIPWRFRYDCLTFDVTSMTGEDVGPDAAPGNLEGDVEFQMGQGCAPFDYGYAGGPELDNLKPTARIDARPKNPKVGQAVTFDGSASFDDKQTPSQLSYAWDFDGDGTFEGSGRSTKHAYDEPGSYPATLRVTDAGGLTDLANTTIVVTGCPKSAAGTNQLNGTPGADKIIGTPGDDVICGLGGKDRIRGNGGDDLIIGGAGKDVLRGNGGADVLSGERANDRLSGGGGKDRLLGGPGRDRMRGGPGKDQLVGGPGRDRVLGNENRDGCGKDATSGCERSAS